ncbi:MAG: hypothetical protein KAT34_16335 [Candidatus Aminicenantes bacterium]|nr:hypothetical protein [Candidatus Aminicenantes bacterium]
MPENFKSPAKVLIRKEWSKKIIEFIKRKLGKKIIYLGLPSPNAEDIMEWLEYIDEVIAFQCREYPEPSNPDQSREKVIRLEQRLNELERQQKIETYAVYDGYIEEVLLRGRDNSNIDFFQNDAITIYNLDFCNQITSPISFTDKKGELKSAYKFDAVKELMNHQSNVNTQSKKFIMFLTMQCGYDGKELHDFITHHGDKSVSTYMKQVKKIPGESMRKSRFLKSYVLDSLKDYFKTEGFIPEFLPVIFYEGVGGYKLLQFTVLGTSKTEKTGTAPFFQSISELLWQKFIIASEKGFKLMNAENIEETDVNLDPRKIISSSKTYEKLWITK